MAAFAAAVSLKMTLRQLQDAANYPYPQITVLLKGVHSLISFLMDNREVKREFETRIRGAIYEAQDITDSLISSTHTLSPSEAEIICEDLDRVVQKINSLAEMTRLKEFYDQILDREISVSVWKRFDDIKLVYPEKVVGRNKKISQLKARLMKKRSAVLEVVPIVGIAGMGKTALACCLYYNPSIRENFHIFGWVKVPIEYNKRGLLLDLLRSMKKLGDEVHHKTDNQLVKYIYSILKRDRYLIVLDDIRDIAVWNDLKELFPEYHNRSRILLTTRNVDLAIATGVPLTLRRLTDEHTLSLLQKIVFREEPCPPELVVIAKDIAHRCRGLPLAAVIVGRLLLCAKLMEEYWEIVLSSMKSMPSLTGDYYVDIVEALVSLTYKHLPQQLKACILYTAMFPFDYQVPIRKLIDLWIAEGFIDMNENYTCSKAEQIASLISFNQLVKRDFISIFVKDEHRMEGVKFSDEVFHDFFMKTAMEENFFSVINKDTNYGDCLQKEYITYNQQRRLFIRKDIVPLVIHNDYSKKSISKTGSLLYYGPEHQYPLSAWVDFKMLKVLDAFKIRFYCFPNEILKLFQLRYLALSYNRELPGAVYKLCNLQFFIVLRYHKVKKSGAPSYLPLDIWNMKALRQLEVMGNDLPEPLSDTDLNLENLIKLSGVSSHSCSREILERLPNLLDLRIQIESLPEDESLNFFSHLEILTELIAFECVVKYPNIGAQAIPCVIPAFPSSLGDLSLDGCGFPLEYMRVIATLPSLRKLKLRNYAFQGGEWEVKKDEFSNLYRLLLEDMDLKNWILADQSCFPAMQYFTIRHCYKLQGIPYAIGDIPTLQQLEVVDCSKSAMNSALKIKEERLRRRRNDTVEFNLYSSVLDD